MPVFVGTGTSSFMKVIIDGVGMSTATTTTRDAISGVRPGQMLFNHTTNLMEYYNGTVGCYRYTTLQLQVLIIQTFLKHKSLQVLI